MQLLRTILIIVLCYYAFRFIARIAFPFILRRFVNKAQQNMQDQFNQMNGQQNYREGEVHIKSGPKQQGNHQVEAEDVDFEEVK